MNRTAAKSGSAVEMFEATILNMIHVSTLNVMMR